MIITYTIPLCSTIKIEYVYFYGLYCSKEGGGVGSLVCFTCVYFAYIWVNDDEGEHSLNTTQLN